MSDEVRKVTVQIRPPKGTFPGEVAEGFYCVVEGHVVLTDETGQPVSGAAKHYLASGEDARLIACRMVRNNRKGRSPFGTGPIRYPNLVKI